MVRIAIIDDDKCFSSELKEQILRIDNIFEVFCYENIEEFTADAPKYNIAIVDIILDKDSGIDLAERLAAEFPLLNIIFVSSERDFFQDVYRVSHSYFMVKPVSDSELKQAIKLCCENLNKKMLSLKQQGKTQSIDLNNVAYFEGILKKTMVHYTDNTNELFNIQLREIEKRLCNTNFIRTHQSYIVNMQHVLHASRKALSTKHGDVPISRKYSASVTEAIGRYFSGNFV